MKMRPLLPEFWSMKELALKFTVTVPQLRHWMATEKIKPIEILVIGDPKDDPKPGKFFINYHAVERLLGGPVTDTNVLPEKLM